MKVIIETSSWPIFPSKTWSIQSPEVKQWFAQLKKSEASVESINAKYGGQYSGKTHKSNKQSITTNKYDNEVNYDASTSKADQKERR